MPRVDKKDPMFVHHVPWWKRKWKDGGQGSDASENGLDDDFDRDEVMAVEMVVPEEDLQ